MNNAAEFNKHYGVRLSGLRVDFLTRERKLHCMHFWNDKVT